MGGILLQPKQIDSKSGLLTLIDKQSNSQWSPDFEVVSTPYMLVAYSLLANEKVSLHHVARLGSGVKQSPFTLNGSAIELTLAAPSTLVALSGVYRATITATALGRAILHAIPQHKTASLPSPPKSADINSVTLKAGAYSPTILVYARPHTITVFDLPIGGYVEVFVTAGGVLAAPYSVLGVPVILTPDNTTAFLDRTGEYSFRASHDCIILITPNYVEFDNPYITKGEKGDRGAAGADGAMTPGPGFKLVGSELRYDISSLTRA